MLLRTITTLCFLTLGLHIVGFSQSETLEEPTGLPGDGFSLEGALELFKTATSPEDFEQKLNTEENYVNNLDLNEDGEIDFIRVEDHMEGDVHAIVLQVPISKKESQDIAVIEIEKTGKEEAILQIIGDEDLYGESVIAEPFEMEAKSNGKGPNADVEVERIIVNVWFWPCVRFIYVPSYVVYVSPWYYGYYPVRWWRPWRVRPWASCNVFWRRHYHPHFRVVNTHRVVRAHRIYTPRRKTTTVVRTRTVTAVAANKKAGKVVKGNRVVSTKKTTVVKKTDKGVVAGQKKTTIGAKKTDKGVVAGKKTTTKGVKKTDQGVVAGKKTKTTKVGKTDSGKVGAKRTTTTKKAGNNGNKKVGTKRSTTKVGKRSKSGRKAGVKKTTTTRRKKN